MKSINVAEITRAVKELCIEANHGLSKDMVDALDKAKEEEKSDTEN